MRRELTVTDLTRMGGRRVCLAGQVPGLGCVRPELEHTNLTEDWLRVGAGVIRPFAVVELDLLRARPEPPHAEDWVIHPTHRVVRRVLGVAERRSLLVRLDDGGVADIFGASVHADHGFYVRRGEGERSLGTVRPERLRSLHYGPASWGKLDYRLGFVDRAGAEYRLTITDLAFRYCLDYLRVRENVPFEECSALLLATLRQAQVYLRVGLARHWAEHPDRCHLQITGVHSFPDYLGGRCHADLALSPAELQQAQSEEGELR